MQWHSYGRNAVLIAFADKPDDWALQKRLNITRALEQKSPPQLVEFVPGFTNVLVEFDLSGGESLADLARATIALLEAHAAEKTATGALTRIPVVYDGPDLRRIADCNGITVEKVIKYHTEPVYKVQLLGFSPGFPYLSELHHKLRTPRLATPRPRVAAGAVAIGGEHTGIYSVDSPGGWNILGRTEIKMFDLARANLTGEEQAFALRPGDQVKFVAMPDFGHAAG